ncbi:MAG: DUF1553 domain-containing protein, partial [Planctomycetaceae bacterium]|nr:DUF1553 domain-containing protein [Planctomycetaceae bacterium]
LSATPSDFGVMGDLPTHPELLDWLAAELMSSGWKMKSLHRLILTSSVYRQASRLDETHPAINAWKRSLKADPDASILSRFPRQRLDAEVIRDAMLAVSGKLSDKTGGRGVMPPLPRELRSTLLKDQWKPSVNVEDHYRRSIYVFARRNLRYPLFDVFDRPDANTSCSRRGKSTTAPQSLLMMNSESSLKCAQELAGLIWDQSGEQDGPQVELLFRRALGRRPTEHELRDMTGFLRSQRKMLEQEQRSAEDLLLPLSKKPVTNTYAGAALTDLCLAIFNTSEFLYVD